MTHRAAVSGFTLIETLVVLAILAGVTATVTLARPRPAAARVNAEARMVASTLQLARSRAMASNTETVVAVDTEGRRIGLGRTIRQLPDGMSILLTVAATERRNQVGGLRFYPDGRSSGGEILLAYHGRRERIVVNWFTGEPRIE
jgi:general secretion pathway protein H